MNIKTGTLALLLLLTTTASWAATESSADEADKQNAAASSRWPAVISTGIRSSDLDRSLRFYTEGLGMAVMRTVNKGEHTEVILGFPGQEGQAGISLMSTKGDNAPVEHGNTNAKIVLGMRGVDAVAARLAESGFKGGDLRQHSRAKILIIRDPDGYKYEIIDVGAVRDKR